MTDVNEPADRGTVLVRDDEVTFEVFLRRDDWAAVAGTRDAHWFSQTNSSRPALTWFGVTDLGDVLYVGDVISRKVAR